MGLLDDSMNDCDAAFVDSDVHGETVTYTTRAGVATSIKAVVVRDVPGGVMGADARLPGIEVHIRNHATYGVTSVNTGGDHITVAERKGGTARPLPISDVLSSDAGMWHLKLATR